MSDTKFSKINGMLVYVCLAEPVRAFQKEGAPAKPDEWKASVVVTDEDYADELEAYASGLGTQISLKKTKTADFEKIYKVAPPEGAGRNVWVLTLRKSTELGQTGKPVPELYQPKVFLKQGSKLVDITKSKLVGNGSYGAISIDKFDRSKGGSSLFLKNVLVTDLVEYEREESSYESGSEFEDEVEGEAAAPAKAETKPAKEAKAKPAKSAVVDADDPF